MNIAYSHKDPMKFIIDLFEKPYSERYNYLEKYVYGIIQSNNHDVSLDVVLMESLKMVGNLMMNILKLFISLKIQK